MDTACQQCHALRSEQVFIFFLVVQQPLVGQGLLINRASRSHSDTPHSVVLLWTSDQPDAEVSTWQHTTLTTDTHVFGGIQNHSPSKRAAADPRLRRRGHRDRRSEPVTRLNGEIFNVRRLHSLGWTTDTWLTESLRYFETSETT
jgi:hypothetical protein